ncbi:hypothetical protein [Streptomyces sp. S1D4-20]|uniref:DUF6907 domain-containing protein n=1 Tax=Streptomyces sp. S1D4-20 TaxID=2594462 RepID=UPI001161EF9A|nr:hypothetical protein [Streptomyces sp. S1D4-20]QDN58692.1 hypothetical protein FNV67_28285 [Streptomyces sp. S1D4-20]
MSTEPRTAQVDVFVTKSLEIDEPDWCVGHRDDLAQYKVDITHYGPEHAIASHGFDLFSARLGQSPFADRATSDLVLYVEQTNLTGSLNPDEVDALADALIEAAARLRELGRDLAAILDGGGQ